MTNEIIAETKARVKLALFHEGADANEKRKLIRDVLRKHCDQCAMIALATGHKTYCSSHICFMQEWANGLLVKYGITPISHEEMQGLTDEILPVPETPAPKPVVVDMTPSTKHPGRPRVNRDLHVVHNGVEQVFSVRPDIAEAQVKLLAKVLGLRKHGDIYRTADEAEKVWLS